MNINSFSTYSRELIFLRTLFWATMLVAPSCCILRAQSPSSTIELRIIVVDSPALADRTVQRLKSGEDFATLARKLSIDPTSSDGGSMGRVDPSALRSEFREALKGLAPGQITKVIRVSSGYAILKVVRSGDVDPLPDQNLQDRSPARILPSAATGTIRYAPYVGGIGEADLAFRDFAKPEGWSQDPRVSCQIRQQSLASVTQYIEKSLDPANPEGVAHGSPLDIIQMHYALANVYSYQGQMDKAIGEWLTAYQIAASQLPGEVPELEEVLGIVYLHKSEMDNDVYRHPGEQCIFPPRSNQSYAKPGASEKAIEYLLKYLQRKPDALDVKWLLNLAYMTLGKYPASVPPQYLIPPSIFESSEDVGRFVDVAPAAGLDSFSMAGGMIVDDFEQNGLFDVVTSDSNLCGPMHYFH
ncbi:MAG: peptidylprolyl isomerase, partial [Candidatus Sulfotelmatobacter sp.]